MSLYRMTYGSRGKLVRRSRKFPTYNMPSAKEVVEMMRWQMKEDRQTEEVGKTKEDGNRGVKAEPCCTFARLTATCSAWQSVPNEPGSGTCRFCTPSKPNSHRRLCFIIPLGLIAKTKRMLPIYHQDVLAFNICSLNSSSCCIMHDLICLTHCDIPISEYETSDRLNRQFFLSVRRFSTQWRLGQPFKFQLCFNRLLFIESERMLPYISQDIGYQSKIIFSFKF